MNNEQNNNMFGIPNTQPQNNQGNNQTIPGANLTPITPNTIESTNQVSHPTMSVNPIPGIVTENSNQTNGLPPINNTPLGNNSSIPEIVNSLPPESTNSAINNLGMANSINTAMNNQQLNPVIPEINNPNTMVQPVNNNQAPNNNFGDATPITNQGLNNNDEVVTVKQYLIYTLLCCIPFVGFIIMLMKAFGNNVNKNISNLAKAQLLLAVIVTVIGFVFGSLLGSLLVNMLP